MTDRDSEPENIKALRAELVHIVLEDLRLHPDRPTLVEVEPQVIETLLSNWGTKLEPIQQSLTSLVTNLATLTAKLETLQETVGALQDKVEALAPAVDDAPPTRPDAFDMLRKDTRRSALVAGGDQAGDGPWNAEGVETRDNRPTSLAHAQSHDAGGGKADESKLAETPDSISATTLKLNLAQAFSLALTVIALLVVGYLIAQPDGPVPNGSEQSADFEVNYLLDENPTNEAAAPTENNVTEAEDTNGNVGAPTPTPSDLNEPSGN